MKRAFVGQSTPIFFDYKNGVGGNPDGINGWPNPVLENVNGMLLCYDEIWFISRQLCPIDLIDLPYVRFIEDDPTTLGRAQVARDQFTFEHHEMASLDLPEPPDGTYTRVFDTLRNAARFDIGPDNHSRTVRGGFYGNAADSRLFLQDIGIAAALGDTMDVVTNSVMGEALCNLNAGEQKVDFTQLHIDAAERSVALRTIDRLGPRGAYHESIEDLRSHPRLSEFRKMLTSSVEPADAAKLAEEVNRLADKHARNAMDRYLRGNGRLETIGSASIGTGVNAIAPGFGSALSGLISAGLWLRERARRNEMAWSLFILDARLSR